MNFRTTYLLFALLLIAMLAVIITLYFSADDEESEGYLFGQLHAADIQASQINRLEIEQTTAGPEKLVFTREEEGGPWKLVEPRKAIIDSDVVDNLVSELLRAQFDEDVEVSESGKVEGLDNPTVTVRLQRGADFTGEIKLGNVTVGGPDALVYVLAGDDDTPRAVLRSAISTLFKREDPAGVPESTAAAIYVRDLSGFRPLRLFGSRVRVPTEEVTHVALKQGDQALVLDRDQGNWKITEPSGFGSAEVAGGPSPGQAITGVRPLLSSIFALQALSTDDYIENVEDFAEYGLSADNPERLVIEVRAQPSAGLDGTTPPPFQRTVYLGKAPEDEDKKNKVYARIDDDSAVVMISDRGVKELRDLVESPKAIRDRTLLKLNTSRVDAVQVQLGPTLIELYRMGTPAQWKLFDSSGTGRNARESTITALFNALTQRNQIADFPEKNKPESEMGFENPEAVVKLWVEGIIPPKESEDDEESAKVTKPQVEEKPTVTLTFGKKEADLVYVKRVEGDQVAYAMVPESLLTVVKTGRLEYLDPQLEGFPANQVVKLSFNRGDDTYLIERDLPEAKLPAQSDWKIVEPERLKDRAADAKAVANIVQNLASLTPLKLIDDSPSAATLKRLGLEKDAVQTRVTVTTKDGDEEAEHVYLFGNDATAGNAVYAKVADRDLIFTVGKFSVNPIREGTLQDMTVLKLDPGQVVGLTLKGWETLIGTPVTREFERKDGIWSLKGETYEIDQSAVNNFLLNLQSLEANEFVVLDGKPKPEHKLTLKEGALEITIKLDEEEEPITLTLGGPTGNPTFIYAQASTQPGDVFTVLADRFKTVKAKPAVFRQE